MFQIIKESHIRFSRIRFIGYIISGAMVLASIIFLIINGGPSYGIDFSGGTKIGLEFSQQITTGDLRIVLSDLGEKDVKIFRTQDIGSDKVSFQIQVPPKTAKVGEGAGKGFSNRLIETIKQRYPGIEVTLTGEENVSAAFGKELQWSAILALLIGLVLILIYIGIRIDFKFAVGTVLAVFHDVIITLSIITLIGIRVDITVIAALLTILGYSVNDSIVVSKRVQELIKLRRGAPLIENVDEGINNTLSRTIITALTTLFTALAIVIFAANTSIYPFAMTMSIGIVVGTYSSIFIVASLVIELDRIFPSRKRKA